MIVIFVLISWKRLMFELFGVLLKINSHFCTYKLFLTVTSVALSDASLLFDLLQSARLIFGLLGSKAWNLIKWSEFSKGLLLFFQLSY